MIRVDSDIILARASETLRRAKEHKKPVYLHVQLDHNDHGKDDDDAAAAVAFAFSFDTPPLESPSIVATPSDTLDVIENRIARLCELYSKDH